MLCVRKRVSAQANARRRRLRRTFCAAPATRRAPRPAAAARGVRRGRSVGEARPSCAAQAQLSCRAAPDLRPPAAVSQCTPWSPRLRAQPTRERAAPGVARCFLGAASSAVLPASVAMASRPRPREARGRRRERAAGHGQGRGALQVAVTWRRRLGRFSSDGAAAQQRARHVVTATRCCHQERAASKLCVRSPKRRLQHRAVAPLQQRRRCTSAR